jgi:hypothetical protein
MPQTILSETDAWHLYIAHIANTLLLEINHKVNWSITNYGDEELKILLDARNYYYDPSRYSGSDPGGFSVIGWVTPAPPDQIQSFLKENKIIQSDRLHTIGALLDWCRWNLIHYSDSFTAINCVYHWQYRGLPPVSRIIGGTCHNNENTTYQYPNHWTAGCWGTTDFMISVLRVANIPVEQVGSGGGHAAPYFVTEEMYLSHGDDPYDYVYLSVPQYPAIELLIDQQTFTSWFGNNVSDSVINVGRQPECELVIKYLPNFLLLAYSNDVQSGVSHNKSTVYFRLSTWYNVSYLEQIGLWDKLAQKVDSLGGVNYLLGSTKVDFKDGSSAMVPNIDILWNKNRGIYPAQGFFKFHEQN